MKVSLILVLLIFSFSGATYAADSDHQQMDAAKFAEVKAKILQNLDAKKNCVSAANKIEDLKACRQEEREHYHSDKEHHDDDKK